MKRMSRKLREEHDFCRCRGPANGNSKGSLHHTGNEIKRSKLTILSVALASISMAMGSPANSGTIGVEQTQHTPAKIQTIAETGRQRSHLRTVQKQDHHTAARRQKFLKKGLQPRILTRLPDSNSSQLQRPSAQSTPMRLTSIQTAFDAADASSNTGNSTYSYRAPFGMGGSNRIDSGIPGLNAGMRIAGEVEEPAPTSQANNNGGLVLCPGDPNAAPGHGFGYLPNGNLQVDCQAPKPGYSFGLFNHVKPDGSSAGGGATAKIKGNYDGTLTLFGKNGVNVQGPSTFDHDANFQNHKITNLKAGEAPTDAVNVSQLKEAAGKDPLAVHYDGDDKQNIHFGGPDAKNPVKLANIAPGDIKPNSGDAVTGGQLDDMGLGQKDPSGKALPVMLYDSQEKTAATLGGAGGAPVTLKNLERGKMPDEAVNYAQLQELKDQIGDRNPLAVLYDNDQKDKVYLGGAGATKQVLLTNLTDGNIEVGSKDAINGNQLALLRDDLGGQVNELGKPGDQT